MVVNRAVILLLSFTYMVTYLPALPDPDIFDGRMLEKTSATKVCSDNDSAIENSKSVVAESEVAVERSFEGLDQIGGQAVSHPAAPSLPEKSGGTAVVSGTNAAASDVDANEVKTTANGNAVIKEERSFEGLEVGGSGSAEQQIEVRRSIELRPSPNTGQRKPLPATPEHGGASSPPGERAPAEEGAEIPRGL
jgi:hypothetical protein